MALLWIKSSLIPGHHAHSGARAETERETRTCAPSQSSFSLRWIYACAAFWWNAHSTHAPDLSNRTHFTKAAAATAAAETLSKTKRKLAKGAPAHWSPSPHTDSPPPVCGIKLFWYEIALKCEHIHVTPILHDHNGVVFCRCVCVNRVIM